MAALTDEIREQGAKILQVINNQEQEKLAENRAAVIVQKRLADWRRSLIIRIFQLKK